MFHLCAAKLAENFSELNKMARIQSMLDIPYGMIAKDVTKLSL